jgi:signal transduction histidine kinase
MKEQKIYEYVNAAVSLRDLRGWNHDGKNALQAILLALEWACQTTTETEVRARLQQAIAGLDRLIKLFQQLSNWIVKNRPSIPQGCDGEQVLNQTLDCFVLQLKGQVKLVRKIMTGLWPTALEAVVVERVLYNLLENGRDAMMPKGGVLTVGACNTTLDRDITGAHGGIIRGGRYVVVSVDDDGTGISTEMERQLFMPYVTTKPPGQGTGLGLYTVKTLLASGGGGIICRTILGYGTCFRCYLPAKANNY